MRTKFEENEEEEPEWRSQASEGLDILAFLRRREGPSLTDSVGEAVIPNPEVVQSGPDNQGAGQRTQQDAVSQNVTETQPISRGENRPTHTGGVQQKPTPTRRRKQTTYSELAVVQAGILADHVYEELLREAKWQVQREGRSVVTIQDVQRQYQIRSQKRENKNANRIGTIGGLLLSLGAGLLLSMYQNGVFPKSVTFLAVALTFVGALMVTYQMAKE